MIDLNAVADACQIKIIRNAPVETLGLLLDCRSAVLAPFYDGRYLAELTRNQGISMVLTTAALVPLVPADRGVALCADPLDSLYTLHGLLLAAGHYGASVVNDIAPDARIHPTAWVAERNVYIGSGTVIGPRAVIEECSSIGADCSIGPGSVIGSEGFEVRTVGGRQVAVRHGGGVRIGAHVTIQSNVVVDRALFGGCTEIGDDTVLDNLVHVAHGVSIGRRCKIVSCAVLCGAVSIGDDVWIGPNATISSALRIGDGARVSLGSVVVRDVPPGGHVSGNFAIDHPRFARRFNVALRS
jgi:acyl-[acyl carrier protein]--UDP-N-acetylglucosamine O-acyltransferase